MAYRTPQAIRADYERDPILGTARWLVVGGQRDRGGARRRLPRGARRGARGRARGRGAPADDDRRAGRWRRSRRARPAWSRSEPARSTSPETEPLTLAQAINAGLAAVLERHPERAPLRRGHRREGRRLRRDARAARALRRGARLRHAARRDVDPRARARRGGQRLPADTRDPVPRVPPQRRGPAARRGGDAAVLLAGRVPQRDGGADRRLRLPARLRRALPQRRRGRRAARHPGTRDRIARRGRTTRRRCSSPAPSRRRSTGRVCVFLEPIALYHTRDLHEEGDDGWVAALERRARARRLGADVPRRRRPHDRDLGERAPPLAARRARLAARGIRRACRRPALARAASGRGHPARGERDGPRARRRRDAADGRRVRGRRRRARRRRLRRVASRASRARTRSCRSATPRGSSSSRRTRSRPRRWTSHRL